MTNLGYDATSRVLETDKGRIHYHEAGSGPVLLMIHGSGPGVSGWANFQGNLPVFARHFRCLIIDLPGYGGSEPVEGPPVAGCVEAVLRLLDGLGVERCHILGNSLGGIVGSFVAAYHPQRVTRFVTIGGIGMNVFTAFPGEGLRLLTAFAEEPTRENIETWLRSMVFDQSISHRGADRVAPEERHQPGDARDQPPALLARLRRGDGRRVPRPECLAAHRASRLDPGTHADHLGP